MVPQSEVSRAIFLEDSPCEGPGRAGGLRPPRQRGGWGVSGGAEPSRRAEQRDRSGLLSGLSLSRLRTKAVEGRAASTKASRHKGRQAAPTHNGAAAETGLCRGGLAVSALEQPVFTGLRTTREQPVFIHGLTLMSKPMVHRSAPSGLCVFWGGLATAAWHGRGVDEREKGEKGGRREERDRERSRRRRSRRARRRDGTGRARRVGGGRRRTVLELECTNGKRDGAPNAISPAGWRRGARGGDGSSKLTSFRSARPCFE